MNRLLYIILVSTQIFLTGCGNILPAGVYYVPNSPGPLDTTNDAYANATNARFNCKGLTTIVPQRQVYSNSSGYYEVCRSKTSNTMYAIHGTTQSSSQICFFPAAETSPGMFKVLTYNYICGTPNTNGDGVIVSTTMTGFSAAIIVEGGQQNAMVACAQQDYADAVCPPYSAGNF